MALNKQKLEDLRKTLREKVENSELRQSAADFTRDVEEKYKKVWNDFINNP